MELSSVSDEFSKYSVQVQAEREHAVEELEGIVSKKEQVISDLLAADLA